MLTLSLRAGIKILSRHSNFNKPPVGVGPPAEQVSLAIPAAAPPSPPKKKVFGLVYSGAYNNNNKKIEQVRYPQDIPLNIPKKTKLYIEQTQREKDQSIDMHRIFQVFSTMRTHASQYEDTYLVV
jgi:hypothetical protein